MTLAFQMSFHPPTWAQTHWLKQWATVSTHWEAIRMPAQTCEPLTCTLTIHGHRRVMASGSLRVGSGSWEEPQTKEEERESDEGRAPATSFGSVRIPTFPQPLHPLQFLQPLTRSYSTFSTFCYEMTASTYEHPQLQKSCSTIQMPGSLSLQLGPQMDLVADCSSSLT